MAGSVLKRPVPSTLSTGSSRPAKPAWPTTAASMSGSPLLRTPARTPRFAQRLQHGAVLGKRVEPVVAGQQLVLAGRVEGELQARAAKRRPARVQSRKLRGRPLIELSRVYSICLSRQRTASRSPKPGKRRSAATPML